jgi:RimJ/RimL family protein N-acetyltransferase
MARLWLGHTNRAELAVFEAACESDKEIGPAMRTWREGATYEKATAHAAESIRAWQTGTWFDFAISRVGSGVFLGRVGLNRIRGNTANIGWIHYSVPPSQLAFYNHGNPPRPSGVNQP